jgi:surfactin family lipopeptide synthetase C
MSGSGVVDIYPLTPMQEGLLFHTLLEPESGVYVVQHHGLLEGPLDLAALSASWDQVVQRRSVLRSSFEWEELDRPLQVVHRSVHLPLMKKDWTGLRAEDRESRWEQLLRDDRRQGFDLAQAPLMRFVVVRVGPERHRFLWSHHHILLDGWSLPLLLNEVFSLYEARRKGTRLDLPAARLFRAYVDWIEGQDQEQARAFWRGKLAGYQEPIRLGIDSGVESGEPGHAEETVTLSPAQTKGMEAFCRERQLTLNTLVQGAWALVLGRYSGRRDLVFGEVVSGRSAPLPGIESIVGPLINTLPVRTKLPDEVSVQDWLGGRDLFTTPICGGRASTTKPGGKGRATRSAAL